MNRDDALANYGRRIGALGIEPGPAEVIEVDPGDQGAFDDGVHTIICEVCGQGLNKFIGDDTAVWIHARAWLTYDHEPVPRSVPLATVKTHICDFCGLDLPLHWQYTGEEISARAGNTVHRYSKNWGACEPCSIPFTAGDLVALLDRKFKVDPVAREYEPEDRKRIRTELLSMWSTFLRTVHTTKYIGPRREPAKLHPRMMPRLQAGLVKFWQHEERFRQANSRTGKTISLPGVHLGREDEFSVRVQPDEPISRAVWTNHVQHLVAGIWSSDLYWISADFTRLALMAGNDFEKLMISREELPSKFGFMLFEQSIGEIPRKDGVAQIRGLSWTLVPQGVWLNYYVQGEDGDMNTDVELMRRESGYLLCPNAGGGLRFDENIPLPKDGGVEFITTVLATWFLMNQPGVAEQTDAPTDKKFARSFQREHGRRVPAVRLVDLRRRPRRSSDQERTGRPLEWRVYRKGHWKQQAYGPKHGLRRQLYISAYIAGPSDAPFKERPPTVKILR